MSLNVVLTADKCNFQNHFSDPMILPKNAQIALTKAGMVVPIFIQNILKVPQLDNAQRALDALTIQIDGINHGLTWTELYTAYSSYERLLNWEPNLTANKFFSGEYEMWTNNYVYFENSVPQTGDGDKPKISWVIAKAISDKFQFYDAVDCSDYEDAPIGLGADAIGNVNVTINRPAFGGNPALIYNNVGLHCTKRINTKLNISYNPSKRTNLVAVNADFNVADLSNFTGNPGSITSVNVAGQACMAVGNLIDMDVNGGYIKVSPNQLTAVGSTMAFGISVIGDTLLAGQDWQPIRTYTPELIDIGVEFSIDAVTNNNVYRIIDGRQAYDSASAPAGSPNFRPIEPVCKYNNNTDSFAILCKRGNIINGTYEYSFTILIGTDGNDITTYSQIYQTRFTLNNSAIKIMPLFLSSVATAGNQFNNIQYITAGADSVQQGNNIFNNSYSSGNTISIQPVLDGKDNQEINWWSAIGLHSYHQTLAGQNNQSKIEVSYNGTPLNKIIMWQSNYKDQDNTNANLSYYWIGKKRLSDFYLFDVASETWKVNRASALGFLPKYLNIYVLNLTLKNYSGSYASLAGNDTNTGENRLVGTIPVILDNDTTPQDLEIFYETFNPYYRPLNNPDNYALNEFIIEISFKDFLTDQRKTIDEILGTLKLELNIRRGADINVNKVMGMQGLLPYI